MPKVYLNGEYLERSAARVSIEDRGFLYGDGLYENVRVYRGGFFRFREHADRLGEGAAVLRIDGPSPEELKAIVARVAVLNSLDDGAVRITLTRGAGGRGLRTSGAGPPTVLVTARAVASASVAGGAVGWRAIIARSRRSPVGLPASIKSANRLDAILARLEADEAGVDEAVMLSEAGHVAEGTTCNVFWRVGDRLRTPALDVGILPGVTRRAVIEVARDLDVAVEEGRWFAEALRESPEAFVTMTSLGPVRLDVLDGISRPKAEADLLPRLREAYWSLVAREAAGDPVAAVAG